VNFAGVLPVWWLILSGTLAAGATAALVAARQALARSSSTLALASGPPGDLFDDIPPLRGPARPPAAAVSARGAGDRGARHAGEWHAEHSLAEGVQRGVFERSR